MLRFPVVAALLLVLATGCTTAADRRALVWVNALAVARPDYHVVHEEQLLKRHQLEDDEAVRVIVEPRWANWSHTEVFGRRTLELRDGHISGAELPGWKLTGAIRALSGAGDDRHLVLKRLDALAEVEDVKVTVVVGFKKPMRENDVRHLWEKVPDVALFSPPEPDGLPTSWDYSGYCHARGFDDCDPDVRSSLTSSFRLWTSLLRESDREALAAFGVDLDDVRMRAEQGLWYGMITTAWPEDVKEMVEDPRVGSFAIGQVAL
ncbi:hypothetical protein AB0K12_14915 [Nonomuraea sp. NPDC049419]|uniref:hypothetical protein n=1 Tax=Nonomuraea sp. NPDC049419 TaxID=3155772 RepID=UPI00341F3FFD